MTLRLATLPAAEVDRLRALPLSYASLDGFWPYEMSAVIGRGREYFEETAGLIAAHEVFLRSGIGVASSSPTADLDSVVRVRIPVAFLRFTGYSRVVQVIDEPNRRGVAYGTLPGHPESGREDLTVMIDDDGVVRMHVAALSRPAAWYARLGRPVVRRLQLRMARRFLRFTSPGTTST